MRDETGEVIFINTKSTKTEAKACNSVFKPIFNPCTTHFKPRLKNHFYLRVNLMISSIGEVRIS